MGRTWNNDKKIKAMYKMCHGHKDGLTMKDKHEGAMTLNFVSLESASNLLKYTWIINETFILQVITTKIN